MVFWAAGLTADSGIVSASTADRVGNANAAKAIRQRMSFLMVANRRRPPSFFVKRQVATPETGNRLPQFCVRFQNPGSRMMLKTDAWIIFRRFRSSQQDGYRLSTGVARMTDQFPSDPAPL